MGSKDSGAKTLPFFSEPLLLADGKVLKSNELAYMGLTATKPVLGFSDKARLKAVSSAIGAS